MADLKNYTAKIRPVLSLPLLNGYTINTMPAPGGGPIVAMIHNIISGEWRIVLLLLFYKIGETYFLPQV